MDYSAVVDKVLKIGSSAEAFCETSRTDLKTACVLLRKAVYRLEAYQILAKRSSLLTSIPFPFDSKKAQALVNYAYPPRGKVKDGICKQKPRLLRALSSVTLVSLAHLVTITDLNAVSVLVVAEICECAPALLESLAETVERSLGAVVFPQGWS